MDEEAVKWSAERVGKELDFIQVKLIRIREALEGITEAVVLNTYVQAATSERPLDDSTWAYLKDKAANIVKKNSMT